MTSVRLEALRIAHKARDDLFSQSINVTTALRACRTICSLLKREKQNEWIDLELNGYLDRYKTQGEMEKALPDYRKTRCMYLDEFGRPILVEERLSFIQDVPIAHSIAELESSVKQGLFILGGPRINLIRKKFGVPALQAQISALSVLGIVNAVGNRILDFLNSVILEAQYANIQSDIFEETTTAVDKELVNISRSALEKLVETYGKLSTMNTALEYAQIAFACREVLQDFTDAIFKPEYLRKNEQMPRREQTKDKVYYSLRQKLEGKKDRELELLSAQIDYLNSYFDRLTSYIQKHVHPKGFEPTREDANRCVIYTYLIIGDLIKYIRA